MTGREQRCGQCGAAARPGAPWCTQCYAPMGGRAPAPPASRRTTVATAPGPGREPEGAVDTRPVETASWPCTACDADNPLSDDACTTCGLPFLAGARDSEPLLVLPLVGDLTRLSQARRTWLAVALVAAFVAACAVLGLLLA